MLEPTFAETVDRVLRGFPKEVQRGFKGGFRGVLKGVSEGFQRCFHRGFQRGLQPIVTGGAMVSWKTVKDKLTKWTGFAAIQWTPETAEWLLCHLTGASLFSPSPSPPPPPPIHEIFTSFAWRWLFASPGTPLMTFYVALRLPSLHHGLGLREKTSEI